MIVRMVAIEVMMVGVVVEVGNGGDGSNSCNNSIGDSLVWQLTLKIV